jgi:pyruvate dehydrogenase E1 component beta subunit
MLAAIEHEEPVIYLEHKLLCDDWLDFLGGARRKNVAFDVPREGARGPVPKRWEPIPLGRAISRREGSDLTIVGVGVGVHRALEAAKQLGRQGVSAGVVDLRTVSPLDRETVYEAVAKTGRMLVVDEDYEGFGLSGELAAVMLEAGISARYGRVCTQDIIPYARALEDEVLPNVGRIVTAAMQLVEAGG